MLARVGKPTSDRCTEQNRGQLNGDPSCASDPGWTLMESSTSSLTPSFAPRGLPAWHDAQEPVPDCDFFDQAELDWEFDRRLSC